MNITDAIKQAQRTKNYYPYRIIWIKQNDQDQCEVHADLNKRKINKALKDGFKCFLLESHI